MVPAQLGTAGTEVLVGLAPGLSRMSQVAPAPPGTVGTGILESPASVTSRDVPSSPCASWD